MLTTKHLPRPSNMLLKDYLRDDLSSCSSSGFKSLPRRQCCTTVRFDLLHKDLQAKRNHLLRPTCTTTTKPPRSSLKAASSTTLSALHKASQAVIKAVRLLPFPSYNKNKLMKTRLLSKSLSRRSFWRKAVKEEKESHSTRRWRSFRDFLLEEAADHNPSDQHAQIFSISSESSNIKSDDNTWGSSEFTWSSISSSTANSTENDVVQSQENTLHNKTAVKVAEDPTDAASTLHKPMEWGRGREEKEQFSPVSVLECPFDDEDISSPSDISTCSRVVEGSKRKLIMRRHFDAIASVELEERMTMSEDEDEVYKAIENEDEKVWRLVDEVIRSSIMASKVEKKVLFDFFKERSEEYYNAEIEKKEGQVYKVAEEWVNNGQLCEQVNLDGEMYIREMDKCGGWTNINISDQEWGQVAMELEFHIFTSLLNELLLEDS